MGQKTKSVAAEVPMGISAFSERQIKILRARQANPNFLPSPRKKRPTQQIKKKVAESEGPVTRSYLSRLEEEEPASLQKFLKDTSVSGLD